MSLGLEYHRGVRHPISATVALFGALALCFVFPSHIHAQINGAPASVTSPGFGGRAVNGPPASVTSVGPRGYAPGDAVRFFGNGLDGRHDGIPGHNGRDHDGDRHRHARNYVEYPPVVYAPYPYPVDMGAQGNYADDANADDDADYQGGPTIFDRRGAGAQSYIPPVRDTRPRQSAMEAAPAVSPDAQDEDPPQEPTLLVFKDGHKLEVGNYAIVGSTLFDLTPGHSRKVPLSDLDIAATQKVNDDRGVIFRLPVGSQGN